MTLCGSPTRRTSQNAASSPGRGKGYKILPPRGNVIWDWGDGHSDFDIATTTTTEMVGATYIHLIYVVHDLIMRRCVYDVFQPNKFPFNWEKK